MKARVLYCHSFALSRNLATSTVQLDHTILHRNSFGIPLVVLIVRQQLQGDAL